MPIEFDPTNRGFQRGEWRDRYGRKCSIQESSLATEFCLWLGCDEIIHAPGFEPHNGRIHLTQETAAELIPLLQRFVETGELIP